MEWLGTYFSKWLWCLLDLDIIFVSKMIIVIWFNFYIQSQSTDENEKNEYLEFSKKCCMGCMPSYTYGGYVYINNICNTPEEHHIHSILKKHTDIYKTSLLKLMDE